MGVDERTESLVQEQTQADPFLNHSLPQISGNTFKYYS